MSAGFRSILASPDRRYWRSRANRRVRKARLTRGALRAARVLLLHGLLLALLAWAGGRAHRTLTANEEFALSRIAIEGTRRVSAEAIRGRLQPLIGRSVLELDLESAARLASGDPWSESVSVRRVLPSTLIVSVTEREPCAVAVIGGAAHVVDTRGNVVEPAGEGPAAELPRLVGLERMDDDRLVAALRGGVGALLRLQAASDGWARAPAELDLSRGDRITARAAPGGPALWLDPERVERNLKAYLALQSEIHQGIGPLEHVDLRWRDRITVKPSTRTFRTGKG